MNDEQSKILLVDDEAAVLRGLRMTFLSNGYMNVTTLSDSREVLPFLNDNPVDLLMLDLVMPHTSGQELLEEVGRDYPEIPIIVVTAVHELSVAVDCMRRGAVDYVCKPVEEEQILPVVRRALDMLELKRENKTLRDLVTAGADTPIHPAFADIITMNQTMKATFRYLATIASSVHPVLISGETGTGKELVAKAVHQASGRSGEFITVNIAGLDENLFSDMLFGHKKGAFSGATQDREGLIVKAAGGTIFLDEIGDLSPTGQIKLLRLLQEREYYPLGADSPSFSDARIVTATHRNLEDMVQQETFRKDLYYRLRAHFVDLLPLRRRMEDLPMLINHFLVEVSEEAGLSRPALPEDAIQTLENYDFPGNIRELQVMITDAVLRHPNQSIPIRFFRSLLGPATHRDEGQAGEGVFANLAKLPHLKEIKGHLIEEALHRSGGNHGLAAQLLGVTRQAISKYVRER